MKRTFDIIMAGIGLVLLSPLFLLAAILIKVDSHGPIFFVRNESAEGFGRFLFTNFAP